MDLKKAGINNVDGFCLSCSYMPHYAALTLESAPVLPVLMLEDLQE
jgi:hypothetical protein